MTDPRDHAQRHDANEHTPDVGRPEDTETGQRNAADDVMYSREDLAAEGDEPGPDADRRTERTSRVVGKRSGWRAAG